MYCIISQLWLTSHPRSTWVLLNLGTPGTSREIDSEAANDYALINRARGPYEEIFVLTFKAYGPNAVRSMRLEHQNKYFPYGPRSRLIRALLYTHINKLIIQ